MKFLGFKSNHHCQVTWTSVLKLFHTIQTWSFSMWEPALCQISRQAWCYSIKLVRKLSLSFLELKFSKWSLLTTTSLDDGGFTKITREMMLAMYCKLYRKYLYWDLMLPVLSSFFFCSMACMGKMFDLCLQQVLSIILSWSNVLADQQILVCLTVMNSFSAMLLATSNRVHAGPQHGNYNPNVFSADLSHIHTHTLQLPPLHCLDPLPLWCLISLNGHIQLAPPSLLRFIETTLFTLPI